MSLCIVSNLTPRTELETSVLLRVFYHTRTDQGQFTFTSAQPQGQFPVCSTSVSKVSNVMVLSQVAMNTSEPSLSEARANLLKVTH